MARISLTTGSPTHKILRFALPIVGGSLFQQMYNFIDTLIVGRLIGVDAVAAIGAFYPLSFLVLGFVQGTCIGFTIPLSHSIGKKDELQTRRFLTNGIWLCVALAAILLPLMTFSSGGLLRLLNTPTEILSVATTFTIISFIGIPANILFNYSADVLRAFGDSSHPLYFLIVSLSINIVLDLYFITSLKLGLAGAAYATVISEFIGGLLNIFVLLFGKDKIYVPLKFWQFSKNHLAEMCLVGLPMGLEYSVSAIGAILMQDAINLLGTSVVAAQSAADKIRQLFTLPMESVGAAMATFQAQNFGAKKRARLNEGIKSGVWIQLCYAAVSFLLINLFKKMLVVAVLGNVAPNVVNLAEKYLFIISFFFPVHGLLMIFRNTLQGWGHSFVAIISGLGELVGRALASVVALTSIGYLAICLANPLAWFISLMYCFAVAKKFFPKK